MRIILVRPPLPWSDRNAITKIEVSMPPTGISYIASYLRRQGYAEVRVIDMFEKEWSWIEDFFANNTADVIGMSCLTEQHFTCFRIAALAKRTQRSPVVIMGGPHPSAEGIGEQILRHRREIDFVVRGEGEITFFELMEALTHNRDPQTVKGILFRGDADEIRATPEREPIENLDQLPFPDYGDFDFDKNKGFYDGHIYIRGAGNGSRIFKFAPLVTSRGCPYQCQFCSRFWGSRVRLRSPENIYEEMKTLHQQRGISHFSIVDDCFNVSASRITKLCRLIINGGLPFTWTAVARVSPITADMLKDMKEAGCVGLDFGVESGSDDILRAIGKSITLTQVKQAFDLTKKAGIHTKALLMVGNPGESAVTVRQTMGLIRECRPDSIAASPTKIFPNSHLHKRELERGGIRGDYWITNRVAPYYTAEHSADELRYYRLKIIFSHSVAHRDYTMVIKTIVLMLGVRTILKLGLEINGVRDFCLSKPVLRALIKKLATVK